ncbi:hypothetical protein DB41_IO00030 [Neochlamydia sp. TUME1]|uniref:hypothetical protein n=1 Tax=Neochlamydia sp. TUME1 TaxID=1478174 RepID=UPI000583733B|nr:hypothetical protein [Neochlamydia sp. TUME1]KIC74439.1 hypothetical protein DB41_IO00030 [Neochlamydia sp. TUME1]
MHLVKIGLTLLSTEIGQLVQLEGLFLNNNKLTTLPAEIGHLSHELDLDLGGNLLRSIPNEIKQCFRL